MKFNCKLLAIWVSIILILWIILLYLVHDDMIKGRLGNMVENFRNSGSTPYDFQIDQLNTNYTSIDTLDQSIMTKERELQVLGQKTDSMNRVAYILKYVTIVSISLLVLMICIFVLDFDDLRGPSALAKQKFRSLFNRA
jgi:hypothetical protein